MLASKFGRRPSYSSTEDVGVCFGTAGERVADDLPEESPGGVLSLAQEGAIRSCPKSLRVMDRPDGHVDARPEA